MKENKITGKNNRKKWFFSIAAVIVLLIIAFPFALNFYLQRKLPDLVNQKTPYKLELKNFDLSLISGDFVATDMKISTKNPDDKKITQIKGNVKKIEIRDFSVWKALFNKSYHADQFLLSDSDVKIKLAPKTEKEKKATKKTDLHIKNIVMSNVFADIVNAEGKPVFVGKKINIKLKDIEQNDNDAKIPLAFKEFKIDAKEVHIGVNDFYQINADEIFAANKTLDLRKFHLQPIQKPQNYNAKNIFDFSTERLLAKDFNISKDSLIVSDIIFTNPDLKVTSTGKNTVEKDKNPKEVEMKIGLKNIDFQRGKIVVMQANKDKTASVDNFNFKLTNIVFDKNTVKEKIPFRFTNHDIEADNIYFKASNLQALKIKKISSRNSNIIIEKLQMITLGKSAQKDLFNVTTDEIKIINNKTKYIGQKLNIHFGGLEIKTPDVKIISASQKSKQKKASSETPEFAAKLGFIKISNGKISQTSLGKEKLAVGKFDIQLNNISSDNNQLKKDLPINFSSHLITAQKVFLDAGKYYTLKVGDLKNAGKQTDIKDLQYRPKYSRAGFSKVIAKESDLYTITVKKIGITDSNSKLFKNQQIDISKVAIDGLHCNIYHDLAPPDDTEARYLFSKKLRGMKMPMFVKNVAIKNSSLEYEENAENSNIPGKLTFDEFGIDITNVNNGKIKGRPTVINADAKFAFYGKANTEVNWKFDVMNLEDKYTINGKILKLSAENVNLFVRPYLNVTLDGNIDYLKFDYYGTNAGIAGNFYFKYNEMYVNFLNKKGNERKLLSKVANWFVKNESTGEPDHVVIEKKRESDRSFFSMLWQGIMEGLKKYLI
ncbi:hypothetical protein CHRY9390_03118 [Chryseobacterium aquaeductus]|uniref:DUF748 domain-containing protein n=1 Tax=Chryseobacterium aquaeductus TaxID=2675056 RepID=A0A9N8QRT1_9FLAO|nr:hypothetical protein [Chryseobacterium aquaeductus]CAA7332396.1 hypothetical protein CHRY9390_03118 [Chryseobacterium potabilaquae]CAD7816189.1 hypothetical protein CHRY9390_03118 [Chryseobacterium aquaeductus]